MATTQEFHPVTERFIDALDLEESGPWRSSEQSLAALGRALEKLDGLELVRVLDELEAMCRFLDNAQSSALSDRILDLAKARVDRAVRSLPRPAPVVQGDTWQKFSNPNRK